MRRRELHGSTQYELHGSHGSTKRQVSPIVHFKDDSPALSDISGPQDQTEESSSGGSVPAPSPACRQAAAQPVQRPVVRSLPWRLRRTEPERGPAVHAAAVRSGPGAVMPKNKTHARNFLSSRAGRMEDLTGQGRASGSLTESVQKVQRKCAPHRRVALCTLIPKVCTSVHSSQKVCS